MVEDLSHQLSSSGRRLSANSLLAVASVWSLCSTILHKRWSLKPSPSQWLKGISRWTWRPKCFTFCLVLHISSFISSVFLWDTKRRKPFHCCRTRTSKPMLHQAQADLRALFLYDCLQTLLHLQEKKIKKISGHGDSDNSQQFANGILV